MPTVVEIQAISVSNLETRLQFALETYLARIRQRATELTGAGVNVDEVQRILLQDIENQTGEFSQLVGDIGLNIDRSIFQVSSDVSIEMVREVSDQFKWELEPSAEHCDTCLERSNMKAQSMEFWENIGLPGSGTTTICGIYCKCSLEPV